jgi:protein-S-isoprenylcysteine O-methyltransferase Ste14
VSSLELKVPPVALWAAFAAAIVAVSRGLPAASLPFPGQRALAIGLFVLGVAVAVAGVVEFRRARTTVNPMAPERARAVVRSGVYRVTRNPMYLGMAAALAGVAAWGASLPGIVLVAGFCAYMTRYQIEPEERALLAVFGAEFADYRASVRRWL